MRKTRKNYLCFLIAENRIKKPQLLKHCKKRELQCKQKETAESQRLFTLDVKQTNHNITKKQTEKKTLSQSNQTSEKSLDEHKRKSAKIQLILKFGFRSGNVELLVNPLIKSCLLWPACRRTLCSTNDIFRYNLI